MTEVLFALAGSKRPWLNWVPMPSEAICNVANEVGGRNAKGEQLQVSEMALSALEPPSAMAASRRVMGSSLTVGIGDFPEPDIRIPLLSGRFAVWRYDGTEASPSVPAPSAAVVRLLHEVGGSRGSRRWRAIS